MANARESEDCEASDLAMLRDRSNGVLALLRHAASKLDAPTPCPDWSVAHLLDHLTGGNRFTIAMLGEASTADAMTAARTSFGPDHDPPGALRQSLVDQLVAFTDSTAETCHHVVGDISVTQALRLRVHDVAIHTWDLQQALGLESDLAANYVDWAIDELAQTDSRSAVHAAAGFSNPMSAPQILQAFGRLPPER